MLSEQEMKHILKKFYVELHDKLLLENAKFCALLYANDLLPGGNLETTNEIQTRVHKVTYFMSHIVLPGAQIYVPKLVEVMELCDDLVVRDFAERMKTAMGSGTEEATSTSCHPNDVKQYTLNLQDIKEQISKHLEILTRIEEKLNNQTDELKLNCT